MSKIELLLFDLDDTLYNERTYIVSGFKAVANHLFEKLNIPFQNSYSSLLESFVINGRGKNIDYLLRSLSLPISLKKECIYVYRNHFPDININNNVKYFLGELKKNFKMALITDGWIEAQVKKVDALKIESYFGKVFYSQSEGLEYAKPHERFFTRALEYFSVHPENTLMIGDDREKDILGAKNMSIHTYHVVNMLDSSEMDAIRKLIG